MKEFSVVLTAGFKKDLKRIAKKHRSILSDIHLLIDKLSENPKIGNDLGQNVYKIRLAISGNSKGKSGGIRVITFIKIEAETVVLAEIYLKNEYDSVDINTVIKRLANEGIL